MPFVGFGIVIYAYAGSTIRLQRIEGIENANGENEFLATLVGRAGLTRALFKVDVGCVDQSPSPPTQISPYNVPLLGHNARWSGKQQINTCCMSIMHSHIWVSTAAKVRFTFGTVKGLQGLAALCRG